MVNIQSFAELTKKDVFTDKGIYCGKVTDLGFDMEKFRVKSLIVDAMKGSFLSSLVGDKKGVIVPFPMVHSVGDIVIIKHMSGTTLPETESEEAA